MKKDSTFDLKNLVIIHFLGELEKNQSEFAIGFVDDYNFNFKVVHSQENAEKDVTLSYNNVSAKIYLFNENETKNIDIEKTIYKQSDGSKFVTTYNYHIDKKFCIAVKLDPSGYKDEKEYDAFEYYKYTFYLKALDYLKEKIKEDKLTLQDIKDIEENVTKIDKQKNYVAR